MANKRCIFPFTYKDEDGKIAVYTNCTWADSDWAERNSQPWCPTAVNEDGYYQDVWTVRGGPALRTEGICGSGCTFPTGKNFSSTRPNDVRQITPKL